MKERVNDSTRSRITAQDLAARLGAERSGDGWVARCPAHKDRSPSLSIRESHDGRVLINCFAGCTFEQILAALGLEAWQLRPPRNRGERVGGQRKRAKGQQVSRPPEEPRLAPEAIRAKVYAKLLELLPLEESHRQNLRDRGLPEEEIEGRGYKTIPLKGRAKIAAQLLKEFGEKVLARVPGFVKRTGFGGKGFWTLSGKPGFLIPVRNSKGQIVALKVRADEADGGGKYMWISSASRGGPSPGAPVHVPLHDLPSPVEKVRLTEGPLKADIATVLSGTLTIGIGGVTQYRAALPVLQELGVRKLIISFDADALTKEQVARALQNAVLFFERAGLEVALETWAPDLGKGIDDLLAAGRQPLLHEGEAVWPALTKILRSARTVPEPGVEARAELAGLEERLKEDPTIALNGRVLRALVTLRKERPADAERLITSVVKPAIKGKVKFSCFETALKDIARQLSEVQAEVNRPVQEELEGGLEEGVEEERQEGEEPEGEPQDGPDLKALGPEDKPPASPKIKWFLPDAPVPEEARVPNSFADWHVSRDGTLGKIVQTDLGPSRIHIGPIVLIADRFRDAETGTVWVKLTWREDGSWRSGIWPRGAAVDRKKLIELADHGVPVGSKTARDLAMWLQDFEEANDAVLPRRLAFARFGWTFDRKGFLWGAHFITADGILEADEDSSSPVILRPAAEGDAQLAKGYHAEGDFKTWLTTVGQILLSYPRALTVLLASLSAPLLEILGRPGFVVDLSFRTSTGKTTALRVAASVWGRPDELSPEAAMATWDTTAVGVERLAGVLHSVPVILDDTKRAKRPEDIAAVVYAIASGRGRVRGNPRSLAAVRTWRTVLISSGEGPITAFAQHGGLRARVIELRGLPFGPPCPAAGQEVDRLNRIVQVHFGHLGPFFVSWLLRYRDRWTELKERYLQIADRLADLAEAGPGRRILEHAAVIELTRELLIEALQKEGHATGWLKRDLSSIWTEVAELAGEAPPERRALADVYDWAAHHQDHFYGRKEDAKAPLTGWVGKWEDGENWDSIAFSSTALRKLLSDWGYNPEEVIEGWAAAGWLVTSGDRRTARIKIEGKQVRAFKITREAIEEVCCLQEDRDKENVPRDDASF